MYSEEMLDVWLPNERHSKTLCSLRTAQMPACSPRRGGGGVSDIRRLESFLGFKILNFNIFLGFSEKNEYFWGYENFVDILG